VAPGSPLRWPQSSNKGAVLAAAGRRFAILLGAISAGVAACSLGVAALAGFSLNRSLANGFEGFGALLLVLGFFVGNRGPVRLRGEAAPFFGPRFLRWATPEEHRATIPESALFIVLGLVLIVIGLAIDSRFRLV
jgi:hypothetical protein